MAWTCPEVVRWLRFSPSGLLLATTGREEGTDIPHFHRLWDVLAGRELAHLEDSDILSAQAFASERSLLAFGEEGCRLWDADSGEVKEVHSEHCSAGAAAPGQRPLAL